MKRLVWLALALCLLLTACGKAQNAPPETPEAPEPDDGQVQRAPPLRLGTLNVEFVVDGRDPDRLLALRSDFPWALQDALEQQSVTVEKINVTFGTSGEASEKALENGSVQVVFLSAEDYYPYRSGQIVAVEKAAEPNLTLGLIVSAVSDDPEADDRFAESLRLALDGLTTALAPYTSEEAQGVYVYDTAFLEQLASLYEREAASYIHSYDLDKK